MLAPIIALIGMAASVIGHVIASRAGVGVLQAYARSLLTGFAAVFAALARVYIDRSGADGWLAAVAILLFASWWFIFLNLVQAMESSIRVQLIREMLAGGRSISRAQLAQSYNDGRLVRLRLDRLLEAGSVVERHGHLFVASATTYRLARFFRFLKLMLIGRPSEFYDPAPKAID
jgi:hypothetical protein